MSALGAPWSLALLLALVAFAALGLALAPLARITLRRSATWAPAARRSALIRVAVTPALATAAILGGVLASSLLALAGTPDHCGEHPGHLHLCFEHFGDHASSPWAIAAALALATWALARARRGVAAWWRARGRLRALLACARRDGELWVVATSRPFCAAVGWVAPRVVASDGFLRRVGGLSRAAALAHERAHVARRDALWRAVARTAALAYPRRLRAALAHALDLACERAADESAAAALGDRLAVAQALIDVSRLVAPDPALAPLASSVVGVGLADRVGALLEPAPSAGAPRWVAAALAALAALALALHEPLHHGAESLLGAIFHADVAGDAEDHGPSLHTGPHPVGGATSAVGPSRPAPPLHGAPRTRHGAAPPPARPAP